MIRPKIDIARLVLLFALFAYGFVFGEKPQLTVDSIPPVVTVSAPSGLYNTSITITFTTNEPATIYYTLDGSQVTEKSMEYTGLLSISSEGRTVLKFMALDMVGNRSKEYQKEYTLDTHPPKLEILPGGGVYGADVEVKILPNEPGKVYYTLDIHSPFQPYRQNQLIKITQSCTLTVYAVDEAGNTTDPKDAPFIIDRNIPIVTASHESGLFEKVFKLAFTAAPGIKIYYSFDEFAPISSYLIYERPLPLKPGQTVVSFFGENAVGTRSDIVKKIYTIDLYPPKVTAMVKEEGERRFAVVRVNEKAEITYTTDGSQPTEKSTPYTAPVPVPRKGVLALRVWAKDQAGNVSDDFIQKFSYDLAPPAVTISPKPGVYNQAFKITFDANERCRVNYTLDNTLPTDESPVYSGPIPVSKDSRLVVTFYGIDESGNKSGFTSVTYVLDQTPPKVAARLGRDSSGKVFLVSFERDSTDIVYYTLDGAVPTPQAPQYQKPFEVQAGQRVRYFATDTAGNKTDLLELSEIALPKVTAAPPAGVFKSVIHVQLASNLPGKIRFRMRSKMQSMGEFQDYLGPLLLNSNGLYKIEYYSEDLSGNKSVINEESYLIDLFPPEINVFTQRNPVDSSVTIYFQSSENVTIYYTLDGTNPFTSPTAGVLGNKYFISKDKITLKQAQSMKINFIGEDIAGNRSEMYQFDVNLPTVYINPTEGLFHEILHVALTTFNDATIYYTLDGSAPSEASPVYRMPLSVTKSTTIRFFAVDQYGYKGEVKTADYTIDLPPRPDFVVETDPAIEGVPLTFNAGVSVDEESAPGTLWYHWDFDGDKEWDTDFQKEPKAVMIFKTPGLKTVSLEVRDQAGLTAVLTKKVNIIKDCPKDMVALNDGPAAFCIDKFEYPNARDSVPHTGVSWVEAVMRCRSMGKDLCRISQWRTACAGGAEWDYPYGSVYESGKCNTEGDEIQYSGKKKKCVTETGVYDLTGNAWEWVADREEGYNLIVGGDFAYGKNARCGAEFYNLLSQKEKNVGFRCCK